MKVLMRLMNVTFLELVRQKLVFAIAFLALFLLALSFLLGAMSLDERLRILLHISFGSLHILLVLLVLVLGAHHWQKEIDRQTLFMLLARPVTRGRLFWGKYLGLLALTLLFQVVFALLQLVLISEKLILTHFAWAHFNMWVEVAWLLAFVFSVSVVLRPVFAMGLALCFWLAGYWQNEMAFFAQKFQSDLFLGLSKIAPYLFPQFVGGELRSEYFLTQTLIPQWGGLATLQVFLYTLLLLVWGEQRFQRRDLV